MAMTQQASETARSREGATKKEDTQYAAKRTGAASVSRLASVQGVAIAVMLAVVGIAALGAVYTTRFDGLISTTTIEVADVARQLSAGNGFSSRIVRPLGLEYAVPDEQGLIPEMLHAPVYAYALSVVFRVAGEGDDVVIAFNGLMFLLTGWMVFAIARMLWNRNAAIVATVAYFVSMAAIGQVLTASGATFGGFLLSVAVWSALKGRNAAGSEANTPAKSRPGGAPLPWLAVTGAIFGLAYLGGLVTILLLIPLALFATTGSKRWQQALVLFAAFVLVVSPWAVRNLTVTGTPAPALAPYLLVTHTDTYPGESVFQLSASEAPSPLGFVLQNPREMAKKALNASVTLYRRVPDLINVYLFAFFVLGAVFFAAGGLARSVWGVVLAMLFLQILSVCVYRVEVNGLGVLTPLAICLAAGALLTGLRMADTSVLARWGAVAAVLALVAVPTVSSAISGSEMTGRRTPESLDILRTRLPESAVICTDDPAAVAWYADRTAVLLPPGVDQMKSLTQQGITPEYLYLSRYLVQTLSQPTVTQWLQALGDKEQASRLGRALPMPGSEVLVQLDTRFQ